MSRVVPPHDGEVVCDDSKSSSPSQYIRCPVCRTLTAESLKAQEQRTSKRIAIAVAGIAIVWALAMVMIATAP